MTQVEALYQIVNLHARTGNTSWIMRAALTNGNCGILVLNKVTAKHLETDFINMFYKECGRKPFPKEIPHFCVVGDYTLRGMHPPLIVDNSCFDLNKLEALKGDVYRKGYEHGLVRQDLFAHQKQIELKSSIELAFLSKWYYKYLPWRKRTFQKIIDSVNLIK